MPRGEKGGFPTYWTTYGQGPRPSVLIHCMLAQSAAWGGLARHLSGALTMTAFHMPGHGRSGKWDARGDYQEVTAGMAAAFAATPVDLIGHSFGGTAALRMAAMWPERVRTLTLIEPVFFAAGIRHDPDAGAQHAADDAPFSEAVRRGDLMEAAEAFLARWGEGVAWADLTDAQRGALADQIPLVVAGGPGIYEDSGGLLRPGVLEAVTVPTLLIEGSQSPAIIHAINAGLAARMQHAERSVIGRARHMVPLSHPAQVSTEILRFLRQH